MSDTTNEIGFALSRLAILQRAAVWREAAALGLTATQAAILQELARHGPARVGALAAALGVTQPTLSDALTALVAKGLATRRSDMTDARVRRVCLTPTGEAKAGGLAETPAALAAALDRLPDGERGAMLRALIWVIRSLQKAGAIPVQRMCVSCRHFRPHVHDTAAAPHHCGFVDAAFGDATLRIDCGDHVEAPEEEARTTWARFAAVA